MIEISHPDGYDFEAGVSLPVYLPDCALESKSVYYIHIRGEYLGDLFFPAGDTYPFSIECVKHVPELPLNQVIGIPSLEGKIFEED